MLSLVGDPQSLTASSLLRGEWQPARWGRTGTSSDAWGVKVVAEEIDGVVLEEKTYVWAPLKKVHGSRRRAVA